MVAQLVEHKLPKLGVAGSNPVRRFMKPRSTAGFRLFWAFRTVALPDHGSDMAAPRRVSIARARRHIVALCMGTARRAPCAERRGVSPIGGLQRRSVADGGAALWTRSATVTRHGTCAFERYAERDLGDRREPLTMRELCVNSLPFTALGKVVPWTRSGAALHQAEVGNEIRGVQDDERLREIIAGF